MEVVGRGSKGGPCGHTWAAQPPVGPKDGIRAGPAHQKPDGRPSRPPSSVSLQRDPPSGSTEARVGRDRGTGCAGHLSPLTRPPRGRPPGGWEAEPGLVPTACPQRAWEEAGQQVAASWGLGLPRPASAGQGQLGQALPGLSFCICDSGCSPSPAGSLEQSRGADPNPRVHAGSRETPWNSQLCRSRARARGQGSCLWRGGPQTRPQSRLGELRVQHPLSWKSGWTCVLAQRLQWKAPSAVEQSRGAGPGSHWPGAWPLARRSCPDLRLREKRPATERPGRAPALKGLLAHQHVPPRL